MDHGSLGDEPVSRPGPLLDHFDFTRRHVQNGPEDQLLHSHLPHHSQPQYLDRFDESLSPHAATNSHPYSANAIAPAPAHHLENSRASADDLVDPSDFYRSYQNQNKNQNQNQSLQQSGNVSSPVKDPMAPTASSSTRQTPSARSNGNGTTPKHPAVPATHRTALRPSQRSASNPVDSRSGGNLGNGAARAAGNGHGTVQAAPLSVRDLKKKFDQSTSQTASTGRKPAPRTATRDTASSSVQGRSPGVGSGTTSHGSPRTTAARDTGRDTSKSSGARSSQRPRTGAGDQTSSSAQSFASRISKPRAAGSTNAHGSKSMTTLASGAGTESSSTRPAPPRQNGLLFGEILPELSDSVTPGFGIETVRPRRTSESNAINPVRTQMRSLSDPDIEPPSPTDWYRAAHPAHQESTEHHASRSAKGQHTRAQSDLAGSKLTLSRPDHIVSSRHDVDSPISPTSPASPTSRLPRPTRRLNDTLNDASSHGSPASTRSSSPSTFKHSTTSGRSSRQQVSSASRARTPSKNPASRIKPPSHIPSPRKPPPANISTRPSSRLNAYVSVPAPKLSPSLRSSRPRQSVATATTAASRMRATERGASPLRQSRSAAKPEESAPRRRKVSMGQIDFAQRRETIKLAYSKSVRESQALEARRVAAEKRKKELAAVARAKAEAEAATLAAVTNATSASDVDADADADADATPHNEPADSDGGLETSTGKEEPEIEELQDAAPDLSTPQPPAEESNALHECRPLRLEIPGSFPGAGSPELDQGEIPLSAVSMASGVTEFDHEVQTEPPKQEGTSAIDDALGVIIPSLTQDPHKPEPLERPRPEEPAVPVLRRRSSYHDPFEDDEDDEGDGVSIKISLDTSAPEPQPSPELTPTRTTFDPGPEPAATPAPAEDDEYVPQPYTFPSESYETKVTILDPNNDFKPLHNELPHSTVPQTPYPRPDESPANDRPEIIASEPPPQVDVRLGESGSGIENLDRIEDFYIGSRLRDNVAALRDSTFTSSDSGTPLDGHLSPAEYQKTPDTSHSLTVPGLLAPGNRLSQHSAWTDFSIGSEDHDLGNHSSASQPREHPPREAGGSLRIIPSTGDLSTCASSLGDLTQSPETAPPDKPGAASSPMLPDFPAEHRQFPEFPTVSSFTLCNGSESGSIAPSSRRAPSQPSHIPPSERDYDRDSTLHLGSRPSSYVYSHDAKGDRSEATSAPQSVSHMRLDSLDPSRVSLSDTLYERQTPLTEKEQEEQKRLRQRELVIRELIDTEDAFVRDMTVVEEIYKGTAEACPNLDSKTVKVIFRNTDEIIAFHATLLVEFKEGASTVYTPKGRRSPPPNLNGKDSDSATLNSVMSANRPDREDDKDRLTSLGPVFSRNIEQLKAVHEVYLRSSDHSTKRLVQIQEDKTVNLWLNECNEVAKELTTAWNLDSLLIKPMQRITKYPDIITHLLKYTPEDHPDREALVRARTAVIEAIDEINKTKKNFELVGQIVSNRKRKESDVKTGLARAFGKRVDKLQVSGAKTPEDDEYQRLQQQFGDDYVQLQLVLRDVEFYTRDVATYVHAFLQYLSSMELVMRLQPSRDYAHLESKWVQFNVSMRDIEKIALERHLADVRKHVIEPFEQVIRCYGNPNLAMKKRAKRRLDYEKYMALKASGKKIDKQLAELVEQYEALNDTLKKELPKLSAMTAQVGNICLGKFISIQAAWYKIWKEKVKAPLQDVTHVPELSEIVSSFQREFALQEERVMTLGIVSHTVKGRASQSTADDASILSKTRSRPSDITSPRSRGLSINSDYVPTLPTPEFAKRNSGQFSLSPASSALPSPANYYRDYYSGVNGQVRGASGSPITSADATASGSRPATSAISPVARPNTGRSLDLASLPRQSSESTPAMSTNNLRDSNSTFNSSYPPGAGAGGSSEQHARRLSGLFNSALPLPDGPEESVRSSRASSRERGGGNAYNVLWLAASLFEFNIENTKHEAGYPYLTYQAGEIFDVIAEKGELWLAKNQDDPHNVVGWIWSKHFAKLADS
ncbi:uncharacterized protein B0T15DRAFT_22785 [Chaetomium strumarium]|uniref:DH domain-containing protein n=1 Tax=Chaetomium strumarium TaxID=1170767 RepID=A0AAJ0H1Z7_9PEZI|nr:hypothetical protein B0T15DRAFT_22785 [Chaetomium strumarium]